MYSFFIEFPSTLVQSTFPRAERSYCCCLRPTGNDFSSRGRGPPSLPPSPPLRHRRDATYFPYARGALSPLSLDTYNAETKLPLAPDNYNLTTESNETADPSNSCYLLTRKIAVPDCVYVHSPTLSVTSVGERETYWEHPLARAAIL